MEFLNVAFYRFVALSELPALRKKLRESCVRHGLRGTILLSPEGINSCLCGEEKALRGFLDELEAIPGLARLEVKESWSSSLSFARMLVKLKREIIPMGRPEIRPALRTGPRLAARELARWLDENRDVMLLDTRNQFEVDDGTFEGARSLGLRNFREFPEKLADLAARSPETLEKPVVMFCTGGIRCEKATALALEMGFKDVYQLEGGILRYFEECGGKHYRGDCFVFDERVALDPELRVKRVQG